MALDETRHRERAREKTTAISIVCGEESETETLTLSKIICDKYTLFINFVRVECTFWNECIGSLSL